MPAKLYQSQKARTTGQLINEPGTSSTICYEAAEPPSRRKIIINVDETWLSETSHIRRTWGKRDDSANMRLNAVQPRVSMIAALDSDGRAWFTLTHANTDSNVLALFFHHLKEKLDQETPGW